MSTSNKEKLAIITGTSSGIGKHCAQTFLAENYSVIGIDLSDDTINHENYCHYTCDITDYNRLEFIIKNIDFLKHNVLVNCAGVREICSIDELSIELWEKVISVNVSSVFVTSNVFAKQIKNKVDLNGSIINISSVSGLIGEPNRTAYVTSKHAVIGLTKQLAIEYGKFGIRVNAIAPGVVRTPLTEDYYDHEDQLQKIYNGQFINHLGTPEDISPLILFLASDKANFITGATMVADGGWSSGKLI